MEFKGLKKSSLIEWPKKIVAVAFTGGCNFRCPFCQNKDLVLNSEKLPTIKEEEVIAHLKSKEKWLDGLAISGGEPTLHPSLPDFAQRVKENGFDFGLETNGTDPKMVNELIKNELVDYFFIDIKAPLRWERYKEAIGVDNKTLFENLKKTMKLLKNSEIDYEYRTTAVPDLLDEADLIEIGKQLRGKTENYYLQQFVPENTLDKKYEQVEPFSAEELKKIRESIKDYFETFKIRNLPPESS